MSVTEMELQLAELARSHAHEVAALRARLAAQSRAVESEREVAVTAALTKERGEHLKRLRALERQHATQLRQQSDELCQGFERRFGAFQATMAEAPLVAAQRAAREQAHEMATQLTLQECILAAQRNEIAGLIVQRDEQQHALRLLREEQADRALGPAQAAAMQSLQSRLADSLRAQETTHDLLSVHVARCEELEASLARVTAEARQNDEDLTRRLSHAQHVGQSSFSLLANQYATAARQWASQRDEARRSLAHKDEVVARQDESISRLLFENAQLLKQLQALGVFTMGSQTHTESALRVQKDIEARKAAEKEKAEAEAAEPSSPIEPSVNAAGASGATGIPDSPVSTGQHSFNNVPFAPSSASSWNYAVAVPDLPEDINDFFQQHAAALSTVTTAIAEKAGQEDEGAPTAANAAAVSSPRTRATESLTAAAAGLSDNEQHSRQPLSEKPQQQPPQKPQQPFLPTMSAVPCFYPPRPSVPAGRPLATGYSLTLEEASASSSSMPLADGAEADAEQQQRQYLVARSSPPGPVGPYSSSSAAAGIAPLGVETTVGLSQEWRRYNLYREQVATKRAAVDANEHSSGGSSGRGRGRARQPQHPLHVKLTPRQREDLEVDRRLREAEVDARRAEQYRRFEQHLLQEPDSVGASSDEEGEEQQQQEEKQDYSYDDDRPPPMPHYALTKAAVVPATVPLRTVAPQLVVPVPPLSTMYRHTHAGSVAGAADRQHSVSPVRAHTNNSNSISDAAVAAAASSSGVRLYGGAPTVPGHAISAHGPSTSNGGKSGPPRVIGGLTPRGHELIARAVQASLPITYKEQTTSSGTKINGAAVSTAATTPVLQPVQPSVPFPPAAAAADLLSGGSISAAAASSTADGTPSSARVKDLRGKRLRQTLEQRVRQHQLAHGTVPPLQQQ
jgi:hypothetical protein